EGELADRIRPVRGEPGQAPRRARDRNARVIGADDLAIQRRAHDPAGGGRCEVEVAVGGEVHEAPVGRRAQRARESASRTGEDRAADDLAADAHAQEAGEIGGGDAETPRAGEPYHVARGGTGADHVARTHARAEVAALRDADGKGVL